MGTIDSILNFAVPALIIFVVIGFVWTKLLAPSLWPWMKGLLDGAKRTGDERRGKEIIYGDTL